MDLRALNEAYAPDYQAHHRRRLIIATTLGYLASWAVGVGFGVFLRHTSAWANGAQWEQDVLRWVHDRPLPPVLDLLMLFIPFLGTNLTILPIAFVVSFVLWRRYGLGHIGLHLFVVAAASLSMNPPMKYLLDRPRPMMYPLRGLWTWASYPSGHMILTPALYFTISLMLYRGYGWRWPYVATVALIMITGYSRLYLAVHWPTDLIGGLLIGFTWLFTSWHAFHRHHVATNGK